MKLRKTMTGLVTAGTLLLAPAAHALVSANAINGAGTQTNKAANALVSANAINAGGAQSNCWNSDGLSVNAINVDPTGTSGGQSNGC